MSEFGTFSDGAFQLKTEGENIRLEFKKGVPATGQGTVEWNIPTPAEGCESGSGGAYAGMVILLSTSPMTAAEIPQDGKVYVADQTADTNLHVGDKIGNALVIGAIYECDEKNREEELTTHFVVSNLDANTPYYVAGYAADCQFRYHSDGARAYSDKYGDGDQPDAVGQQLISFGQDSILPTDGTDLAPGVIYAFDIVVDRDAPTGRDFDVVEINIDGINAGTYDDLIRLINDQIKQVNNPPTSPVAPNSGTFFYDAVGETLFQFDGFTYTEVPAIIEATDPTIVADGDYWYDTTNSILYFRVAGAWVAATMIVYATDPRLPTCEDFWFNGTDGKSWNGTTWCEVPTVVQADDPSVCVEPECGTFWYDETNAILSERNTENKTWVETSAISWNEDPQALSDGTYWFDLDANTLSVITTGVWADITNLTGVYIQDDEPVAGLVDGDRWYAPSTEVLSIYNLATTTWVPNPVLVWPGDPTDTASCDLWWNTTNDVLSVWDSTNLQWDVVANFVMSSTDPAADPVIVVDTLWYDSTNSVLNKWDGSGWEAVSTIHHPTDPTLGVDGEVWHNTTSNEFFVWIAGGWSAIDPKETADDPTLLPNGTYWYDTTNDALWVRNGISWVSVAFTTVPLIPTRGDNWYDSSTGTLYEWDGTTYIEINGVARAAINSRGQIVILNSVGGSGTIIFIPVPDGANVTGVGCAKIGTGYGDFGDEGVSPTTCQVSTLSGEMDYPVRDITVSGFLWEHIMPAAAVQQPQEGQDGLTGKPSYDVIGVGDDGTPDERRELSDSIRAQLGHPVVTVELTKFQIDTAIQGALESFRKRSSMAYRRGFFFLDVAPQQSRYILTNKRIGYNKIVNITSIHRFTSAFLSTAHGAGVYGQVVLQHLYNMGTYDLTSFHLVSQYVEQLEHLFATRIVYNWDESERTLDIYQSFSRPERMLMDCEIERTEQDLFKDRYAKSWIERYALSECQYMLAQIRGKYGSLPGAGGGISLNAAELTALADMNRADLMAQIDDYVVQDLEDIGMHSTFIIG